MTTSELRELDAFCAEHVMGWKNITHCTCSAGFLRGDARGGINQHIPRPTTDPAAAFEVLKKCADRLLKTYNPETAAVQIYGNDTGGWVIWYGDDLCEVGADTLQLAIALFAKQIFSK